LTAGKHSYKRIVIKIGSNVLTRDDGKLHKDRIAQIVNQIAEFHNQGVQVILISSGAVAAGKGEYSFTKETPEISAKQVWSAIGQVKLMVNYFKLFGSYNIQAGQILATKENFQGLRYYSNMENGLSTMLENKIIPIVNENDTITVTELMFTDNDELSGLIASMMNADALFILTAVDGVFTRHPSEKGAKLIREINTDDKSFEKYITPEKSFFGKGGMNTKCTIAQKVAKQGIDVYIASGMRKNIVLDIINRKNVPSTFFKASAEKDNEEKKWLPRTTTFPKASIIINEQTIQELKSKKAVNIMTSGVEKVEGFFEADDLVKIFDINGKQLGIGKVRYSSDKIDNLNNQDGTKPFIDKDFLLLYKH
jgi:glutamate 5-kinase